MRDKLANQHAVPPNSLPVEGLRIRFPAADQASGQKLDRADLVDALAFAREGDTLVVWKLDRLGLDQ